MSLQPPFPLKRMGRWCSWCQKTDHNDEECWSTRTVPPDTTPLTYFEGASTSTVKPSIPLGDLKIKTKPDGTIFLPLTFIYPPQEKT